MRRLPVLNDARMNDCFQSLTATVDCALSERINKHKRFSRPNVDRELQVAMCANSHAILLPNKCCLSLCLTIKN